MASLRSPEPLKPSDLRGIARLATHATTGVVGIAEGIHRRVWGAVGFPGGDVPGRTRGLTGLVYESVRRTSHLLGRGTEAALAGLEPLLKPPDEDLPHAPRREALLAALNGVVGDHLAADDNPLAIPMTLRYRGEPLRWNGSSGVQGATGRVLLMVHGLCMNDLQWRVPHGRHGADHASALASALGYTPVYVRYNSGLRTAWNGRELSAHLERLVAHWPTRVEELAVVAHSMGGLVIRSAFHYADREGLRWPAHLRKIVFLGTPHHGAPLERAGNWADAVLGRTPYAAPFTALGRVRSAGIIDLRYGHVLDDDDHGRDRFGYHPDDRPPVPLPDGVACYAVAASRISRRNALADRFIGDGLVPLRSALGRHDDAQRSLAFAEDSWRIVFRTGHLELLRSPEVTRQLVEWLGRDG